MLAVVLEEVRLRSWAIWSAESNGSWRGAVQHRGHPPGQVCGSPCPLDTDSGVRVRGRSAQPVRVGNASTPLAQDPGAASPKTASGLSRVRTIAPGWRGRLGLAWEPGTGGAGADDRARKPGVGAAGGRRA